MARPTLYTEELAQKICLLVSEGLGFRAICETDEMPDKSTIMRWLAKHDEFCDQYEKAKSRCAHLMAEDIIDIADNIEGQPVIVDGVPLTQDGEIVKVIDNTSVNHARLKVDTRKFLMAKLMPKKYGDKVQQELSGGLKFEKVERVIVDPKNTDS